MALPSIHRLTENVPRVTRSSVQYATHHYMNESRNNICFRMLLIADKLTKRLCHRHINHFS